MAIDCQPNCMNAFKMLKGLLCVVLVAFIGSAVADTVNINEMTDQLIESVKQIISQKGEDVVAIENIQDDWKVKWHHFLKVHGSYECNNGKFRSLTSLHRTADSSMTTAGDKVTLHLQVGLGTLELHYDTCRLKIHRIGSMSSSLKADVSDNSLNIQVSLTGRGAQCVATVDNVGFSRFGRISIHTGGGLFHKIENRLLDKVASKFHDRIVNELNQRIQAAAVEGLAKADLCNRIPH